MLKFETTLSFKTACAEVHGSVASTRSTYIEQNLKTSIEQLKHEMVVPYMDWLIYKDECLFVCLFAMHLDRVRASAAKLSRNLPLIQEKVESYFFPEIISPSPLPKDPPLFPSNGIAVFRFQKEDKSL